MILQSTFVRISLAAVLAIAAVGCRKGDKNLTPIPGGSGNFVGGGNDNPAGSMMPGDNDNLGGGNQFNNNDFQTGDDIGNGAGNLNGSGLPDNPDNFTGKTETRLESSIIYFDFDSYSVKPSELSKICLLYTSPSPRDRG